MTAREANDGQSDLSDLYRGVSVRTWEADMQRRAMAEPVAPGRYPSIPVIRAQRTLNSIESERRRSLSRLKLLTQEVDAEWIEKLKRAGLLEALIDLQTHTWCPSDIKRDAHGLLIAALIKASDEQVNYLVKSGCIRVLCAAPHNGPVQAIRRILEVGEATRADSGRNLYADQIQAHGCLTWLRGVRRQNSLGVNEHNDLEQFITRFYNVSDDQSRYTDLQNTSDWGLGWRFLYPLLKHRRFPRWNHDEPSARAIEETCPLATKLFISHRWATPDDPDPECRHLPTVVEYLSRVFMVANGYLRENSFAIEELVIGDGLRSAFHESKLERCRCGSVGWLDVRSLLGHDDLFFRKVHDVQRRRNFYRLLKHVHVWYDYHSLPQSRGTPEEDEFVDRALTQLANTINQSEVLVLWGLESIKRAWCIFEVLAASAVHLCSPVSSKIGSTDKALLESAIGGNGSDPKQLLAYRGRPSQSIMIHVDQFRRNVAGLSARDIYEYLLTNGIECTRATDIVRIANMIHRHLVEYRGAQKHEVPECGR